MGVVTTTATKNAPKTVGRAGDTVMPATVLLRRIAMSDFNHALGFQWLNARP